MIGGVNGYAEQLEQFTEQGYVVIGEVLDPIQDLQPVIDDYSLLLDRLAEKWEKRGSANLNLPRIVFRRSPTKIMSASEINISRYFDISLPDAEIDIDEPMHLSEPIFKLITNPRLLDVVESFVGAEILSNPVQHVRIKPPETVVQGKFAQNFLVRRTGWHQDQGVIRPEADETPILTVWLPVNEATVENGCLCVIPGSHRHGLTHHCPGEDGLTIPDRLLESRATAVPMKVGSILCMHRLTQHSSLANRSNTIRWSFDLRYQPVGLPTGRQEYPSFVARTVYTPNKS